MSRDPELIERIRAHQFFHTMDLGDGLVTNGDSNPNDLLSSPGSLPDVRGKSVLDIGAWDGKYSYKAEAGGAARVVALDHYVWRLNGPARQAYYDECAAKGLLPDPDRIDRDFLLDGVYPGKKGFDMAHEYLDSKVETVIDDFMTMDLDTLGQFDVVFYFGVLYHMIDPIGSLKRVRAVTKERAVIETAGVVVPGYADTNLVYFCTGDELGADFGNWYAPSESALRGMCRSAGFRKVETKADVDLKNLPRSRRNERGQPLHCRIVAQAFV